jgi:hypothetical protein
MILAPTILVDYLDIGASCKVNREVNPLLGGVPEGRGGLVSCAMIKPPLPLPRVDLPIVYCLS